MKNLSYALLCRKICHKNIYHMPDKLLIDVNPQIDKGAF